jgi:glutamyl-tRNA reductase
MHYLVVSFTHRNTTLAIREKLAFPDDDQLESCLQKLITHNAINEVILISTCNRIEVLCSCSSVVDATEHIFTLLGDRSGISIEELEGRADVFDDQGAIHHLFSVASSLDSMVVGETQIAGQLKDAFRFSVERGYSGQKLSRAMHYAFKCAAEVRNATDISSKPVSIASVAVAQVKKDAGSLAGKKALIIGAGEMSQLSARYLVSAGVRVTMMNRTRSKAEAIAKEFDAEVLDYSRLHEVMDDFDILITATGSREPIIRKKDVSECEQTRYWVDMAVPRDIEPVSTENIFLYAVDDLKAIVEENIILREDEAKTSYTIIGRHTIAFFDWLKSLSVEPLIKEIYLRGFKAAKEESVRAVSKGFIPKEYEFQAEKMCEQAIKRFLHDKMARIRNTSEQGQADMIIESLKYVLGIEDEDALTDKINSTRW